MSRTALRHLGLVGPFAVAAALGVGSLPAFAQSAPGMMSADCSAIHFDLANPGPGARVEQGTDLLTGVAMDKRASDGVGIDHVDFFLDARDQGGTSIGTASPSTIPGPLGPGSFQASVSFPNMVGGHNLVAYAHSSVTGQESVIEVPIVLGEDPSKVAEPSNVSETQTCSSGGNVGAATTPAAMTGPAMTAPATAPATTTAPSTTTSMAPSMSTITLDVGNPSPNDTIKVGGLTVQGVAWDKAATSGSGIDRVDIFLDNRDQGGISLGSATPGMGNTWQATVTIPSSIASHNLSFYAHSSVTGGETLVTVPVTVAP